MSALGRFWEPRQRTTFVLILAVSVGLRVAAAAYLGPNLAGDPGTADQVSYHALALRLLEGHGFSFGEAWWPMTRAGAPTAHWSYLYTGTLALIYGLIGLSPMGPRLIQAVLTGILLPWLTFALGRRLFGTTAGLVAAGLAALYAYFVYYAPALMTESWYLVCILTMLLLAIALAESPAGAAADSRPQSVVALGLGLTIAAAALLRQVILLFVPILFLWIWRTASRGKGSPWVIRHLALASGVVALVILPVTAFNYQRFGQPVLLNTNAGFAFFWANHPIYGTRFQPILSPETGTYAQLIPQGLGALNEAELDQELLRRGMAFVFDDPVRYALLSVSRIPAYFMFWPSSESSLISNLSRVGSFGLLWPFMFYGVALTLIDRLPDGRPRPPGAVLLLLFAVVYSLIHLLSWALVRYRLPVDAVLIPFAGMALVDLAARLCRRRPSRMTTSADPRGMPQQESETRNGMANLL